MKKIYIEPKIGFVAVAVECQVNGGSGIRNDGEQNDYGGAKRHNDFWSDMEETASSWPKGKSVWDD